MNFVFIFFSSVLLLGGLNILLNDEVIVIPLQGSMETYHVDSHSENIVDQYEVSSARSTAILEALDSHNNHSTRKIHVDALAHFVKANKARQDNDTQDTILYLIKALLVDPTYNDARLRLVESYLSNGQRASAEEALDQALIHNTNAEVFVAIRVRMFVQDGHLQQASQLLDTASLRFEGNEELLVLAASIDDQLGDYVKAANAYQQLTIINPLKLSYQVGQAMAIDHTGDSQTAAMLYQLIAQKLANSGSRLPFVDQRLAMLTSKADQTSIQ